MRPEILYVEVGGVLHATVAYHDLRCLRAYRLDHGRWVRVDVLAPFWEGRIVAPPENVDLPPIPDISKTRPT